MKPEGPYSIIQFEAPPPVQASWMDVPVSGVAVNKVGAGQAGALSIVISSIATSPLPEPPPDGFCPRKRSWMLSPGDAADNGTLT